MQISDSRYVLLFPIQLHEIRVNKREVQITGSYAALAQAAAGNPGDFTSVPRFVPKWLPDLGPAD
jgi:hypothetical protein